MTRAEFTAWVGDNYQVLLTAARGVAGGHPNRSVIDLVHDAVAWALEHEDALADVRSPLPWCVSVMRTLRWNARRRARTAAAASAELSYLQDPRPGRRVGRVDHAE